MFDPLGRSERLFGERAVGLMLDYTVANVALAVLLDFGEHAFGHVDVEMAQDHSVVVQVVVERVALVQVAVQEVVALDLRGIVDQLGRLFDE